MEPIAKPQWQTPTLVSLSGVRHSAQGKVIAQDEDTLTFLNPPLEVGPPANS